MNRTTPVVEQRPLLDRLLFAALLVLVAWLPLPWGSNRPGPEAILGIVAGSLCLIYLIGQLFRQGSSVFSPRRYFWPLLFWGLWLGWIFFQTVPLKPEWLSLLAPTAASYYASAFPDIEAGHAWPISLLPEQTNQKLLLSLGYFSLYVLVLGLARDRGRLKLLAQVLVVSALAQAIYGGIMTLTGLEYGFFEKKTAYLGLATGTFVNRNHLAGYLELGAAMAIGLILADLKVTDLSSWKKRLTAVLDFLFSTRLRIRVFLAIIVVGLVLTRSRGGNMAFFTALIVLAPTYLFFKERQLFVKSAILFISLLAVDVWIVSGWFGLEKLATRFEQTSAQTEARTYAFKAYPGLIDEYSRTGSGMGTFAAVFGKNQPPDVRGYFDHAHNDYAEFLIEAGFPGVLILAILAGLSGVHAVRVIHKRNDRLRVGICFAFLMASAELAIHSLTDFNLQIPANAATYIVMMAMAGACSSDRPRRRKTIETASENNDELTAQAASS
ncbi:MAG: O-antigen ligase family protein [Cupriavidus sp.]|nr:MAG: O-antigen ligase family protein [Cupriavidus sp.]